MPKLGWRNLIKPVGILLAVCYAAAFGAGAVVYFGTDAVFGLSSLKVSHETDHRFFAVWIVHNASYLLGGVGGFFLCGWAIVRRIRAFSRPSSPNPLLPRSGEGVEPVSFSFP